MTAPDKVDVAPALGLDTYTFDQETTTLRIWADDAGKVLGFGHLVVRTSTDIFDFTTD